MFEREQESGASPSSFVDVSQNSTLALSTFINETNIELNLGKEKESGASLLPSGVDIEPSESSLSKSTKSKEVKSEIVGNKRNEKNEDLLNEKNEQTPKKENEDKKEQRYTITSFYDWYKEDLDMTLFSAPEQKILQSVKSNFQYTLYVPSIPEHDINQISCDLYFLGNHYEFTKQKTRLDRVSAYSYDDVHMKHWDIYLSNYDKSTSGGQMKDGDYFNHICPIGEEDLFRVCKSMGSGHWLNESCVEFIWHW